MVACLERNRVDKDREEPVERDGRQVDVERVEMTLQVGQFVLDDLFETLLVGLGTHQARVKVVGREVLLGDCHETPEGVLGLEEQERDAHDEVHALAVAHFRVVKTKRLQNFLQLIDLNNY